MAEMVTELMLGLGVQQHLPFVLDDAESAPPRVWQLTDGDVVALAQACVAQLGSLKSDGEAAPLALQANACRNASAVADAVSAAGLRPVVADLCPYPASDSLSSVWTTAFGSRMRWIGSGKVLL
jgi:hypothetical protein